MDSPSTATTDNLPTVEGEAPVKAAPVDAWDACADYLKTVLSYRDYIDLVESLDVEYSGDRLLLRPDGTDMGEKLREAVVPHLLECLQGKSIKLVVGDEDIDIETPTVTGLWPACLAQLETEVSEQEFNTWVRPLQATETGDSLRLSAPNNFVLDWFNKHFLDRVQELIVAIVDGSPPKLSTDVADRVNLEEQHISPARQIRLKGRTPISNVSTLARHFTFQNFMEGKDNQLAKAAAMQISHNPATSYNPLLIYGGVGLGKTHLMQAIGNEIKAVNPEAKVRYSNSERFMRDMVESVRRNAIEDFKVAYRDLDVLLIDDIQFFAGKLRSQEEFFHTFNALLEVESQIILTCDRFPREVAGLEERLKSRFEWGLSVGINPPDLKTRVAILKSKADLEFVHLPDDVAFFIADRLQSNVRELEGALRRVIANSRFTEQPITVDFAKSALSDLLEMHERRVHLKTIQNTVADYYKIRTNELLSKRRNRSIARPRQMAMSLAKELTNKALPEIGDAFGGRDHTTVLHACRKIESLRKGDATIATDYENLKRKLMS